ncbi:MAG: hypothetical protein ABJL18_11390 [Hyphomicrobiales bacterium]
MDIEHLKSWIGRKETALDLITEGLLDRFNKTLLRDEVISGAPTAGIHWCLSPPTVYISDVGEDGHPKRGGFLPPVPLAYRMWASGKINFQKPLPLNQPVSRCSEILDVKLKDGTAGPLIFVDVGHQFTSGEEEYLYETQTLVYKDSSGAGTPTMLAEPEILSERTLYPDSVLLFRYSALTFNGHRIHYDYPYATNDEGYPDLVVHGPMIATFLMHFAIECEPGRRLLSFQFRGASPAFSGRPLRLIASKADHGLSLEARGEEGRLIMRATAVFSDDA